MFKSLAIVLCGLCWAGCAGHPQPMKPSTEQTRLKTMGDECGGTKLAKKSSLELTVENSPSVVESQTKTFNDSLRDSLRLSVRSGLNHLLGFRSKDERDNLVSSVSEMVLEMSAGLAPKNDQDFPRAFWPVEVQRIHPVSVYSYNEDVVIVLRKDPQEEIGYYIVPRTGLRSVRHFLPNGPEWSFKQLVHECLYEYQRAIPLHGGRSVWFLHYGRFGEIKIIDPDRIVEW